MKTNIIHNLDILDLLPTISTESIDLVVTDPPYKIIAGGVKSSLSGVLSTYISDGTKCSDKWLKKGCGVPSAVKSGKMFKHNDILFKDWLPDIFRVLKQNTHCYIMINSRNFKEMQQECENVGFKFQNLLIWDKCNVTPNKYYMQGYECILMLRKGNAKNINNLGTSNILKVPNNIGNKNHPTEKPIELMKILIENSSNENDIVLEPFMGVGSTCIASKKLKRQYIGCEIDKTYFDIAQHRINETSPNLITTLF